MTVFICVGRFFKFEIYLIIMCAKISNAFELLQTQIVSKRPTLQNIDERIFPEGHPVPTSLIEISGKNGSGKTQVLHYLTALSVIPEDFGGKQSRAVLVDLKNKFDPEIFLRQIEHLMKKRIGTGPGNIFAKDELNDESINQIGLNCLRAITIMYCYSAEEFNNALDDIQNLLTDEENSDVALIAVDGLETFYWIENFEKKRRMRAHYAQLAELLREISVPSHITFAYTVDKSYVEKKFSNETELSDYKLILEVKPNNERTLNNLPIDIDKYGIKFL